MEQGIQSSFIPHDAAAATPLPRMRSGGGLSELGLLISIVLLVASGALAGAVFLYGEYAQTSASSKLDQLQRAKAAFEPSLIEELTRLDDRMRTAEGVLSAHLAPTAFFDALQQSTLTTVSFQSLNFEASDLQHVAIKMSGVAEAVNSVALQADIFSKNGVITNPIFSDISRQADGVHFTLSAVVNPAAINFIQMVGAASAAAQAQQGQQQTGGMLFGEPTSSQTQTKTPQVQGQPSSGGQGTSQQSASQYAQ